MSKFIPYSPHDPERDVRDYSGWKARFGAKPNGCLHVVIGNRRAGKTWFLRGLAQQLNVKEDHFLTCVASGAQHQFLTKSFRQKEIVMIDEPGDLLKWSAGLLIQRCNELKNKGVIVIAAMTPREFERLKAAGDGQAFIDGKDFHYLPPLEKSESEKMASRVPWGDDLLGQLPDAWQIHPGLLEVVLELAENYEDLHGDVNALCETAIDQLKSHPQIQYFNQVYVQGLDENHREEIRAVGRRLPFDAESQAILYESRILRRTVDSPEIYDPVIKDSIPEPIRIHQISDLHASMRSAKTVDIKEEGAIGQRWSSGLKEQPIWRSYQDRVKSLGNEKPHLLIVSGDLADKGDANLYEEIEKWLQEFDPLFLDDVRLRIVEHLGAKQDDSGELNSRILLVGGNHDLEMEQAEPGSNPQTRHLAFNQAFSSYHRPRLDIPPEDRKLAVTRFPKLGMEVLHLGSSEFGHEQANDVEQQQLLDQANELLQKYQDEEDEEALLEYQRRIIKYDPGLVHQTQIEQIKSFDWRARIRIAVVHHPVSQLPTDVEIAPYAGLMNAGQLKQVLAEHGFSLVLTGHVHSGWFAEEAWPDINGKKLHIAAAPSLGGWQTGGYGFNEILIFTEGSELQIQVNRYLLRGQSWDLSGTLGPFQVPH